MQSFVVDVAKLVVEDLDVELVSFVESVTQSVIQSVGV